MKKKNLIANYMSSKFIVVLTMARIELFDSTSDRVCLLYEVGKKYEAFRLYEEYT